MMGVYESHELWPNFYKWTKKNLPAGSLENIAKVKRIYPAPEGSTVLDLWFECFMAGYDTAVEAKG